MILFRYHIKSLTKMKLKASPPINYHLLEIQPLTLNAYHYHWYMTNSIKRFSLQSWTKIIAHIKYKAIDSVLPHVLKILTPPLSPIQCCLWFGRLLSPYRNIVWGGGGSEHHVLKTANTHIYLALNRSLRMCDFSLRVPRIFVQDCLNYSFQYIN